MTWFMVLVALFVAAVPVAGYAHVAMEHSVGHVDHDHSGGSHGHDDRLPSHDSAHCTLCLAVQMASSAGVLPLVASTIRPLPYIATVPAQSDVPALVHFPVALYGSRAPPSC